MLSSGFSKLFSRFQGLCQTTQEFHGPDEFTVFMTTWFVSNFVLLSMLAANKEPLSRQVNLFLQISLLLYV